MYISLMYQFLCSKYLCRNSYKLNLGNLIEEVTEAKLLGIDELLS